TTVWQESVADALRPERRADAPAWVLATRKAHVDHAPLAAALADAHGILEHNVSDLLTRGKPQTMLAARLARVQETLRLYLRPDPSPRSGLQRLLGGKGR